jgi:L-fuconolactonase
MLIIDSHQHFWKYNPDKFPWIDSSMQVLQQNFLPGDFLKDTSNIKVTGSVAVQARQTEEENFFLLTLAKDFDFIKGIVGWLDLKAPDLERKIDKLIGEPKFKGLRHVLQDEPDPGLMLNPDFISGVRKLKDYHLTFDILVLSRQLPQVLQLLDRLEGQKLVLDHIGKPKIKEGEFDSWLQNLEKLAAFPNLYIKISGMVTEADWKKWLPSQLFIYLDEIYRLFGPDRILFGSDWPVCKLAANYNQVFEVVDYFARERDCTEKFFYQNAHDFYNL